MYGPLDIYVRAPASHLNDIQPYINQQPSVELYGEPSYVMSRADTAQVMKLSLSYPTLCSALIANLDTRPQAKKVSDLIEQGKKVYPYSSFDQALFEIGRYLRNAYDENWDRYHEGLTPQMAYIYCALIPAYRQKITRMSDFGCAIRELPIIEEYDLMHQTSSEACIKKALQMKSIFSIYFDDKIHIFRPSYEQLSLSLTTYIQTFEDRKKKEIPRHAASYDHLMQQTEAYRRDAILEQSKDVAEKEWEDSVLAAQESRSLTLS